VRARLRVAFAPSAFGVTPASGSSTRLHSDPGRDQRPRLQL